MNTKLFAGFGILFGCSLLMGANGAGCSDDSDRIQGEQQEQIALQATQAVGMPAVTNFQERRILKNIFELRDTQIKTVTYTQDMMGKLHKICDSVGYGIPYATQYTNPMKWIGQGVTIPQADPNGLFSPAAAEGTWVLCLNPVDKKIAPVYIEPRIIASPFPLEVQ